MFNFCIASKEWLMMRLKIKNIDIYQKVTTVDAHTEGEPLRIVVDGYPEIPGDCMLGKRRYVRDNLDHLRRLLMFEPRGHADMYGALITEAVTDDGDFGILFMHNEGYSSMCGHGIIAAVTVAEQCGALVDKSDEFASDSIRCVKIDSPAGRIMAYVKNTDGKIDVSFDCVPSFVECTEQKVQVPGLGEVIYDIAFGGAYYAYVDADRLGLSCTPDNLSRLIDCGRKIKQAVSECCPIKHPTQSDLSFLYGTIFTSEKLSYQVHQEHTFWAMNPGTILPKLAKL